MQKLTNQADKGTAPVAVSGFPKTITVTSKMCNTEEQDDEDDEKNCPADCGFVFPAVSFTDPVVHVCDDGSEWPPYAFHEREDGEISKEKVRGAMIEILDEITAVTGLEFSVKLLPWKRCMQYVYDNNKGYEVFLLTAPSMRNGPKTPTLQVPYILPPEATGI